MARVKPRFCGVDAAVVREDLLHKFDEVFVAIVPGELFVVGAIDAEHLGLIL